MSVFDYLLKCDIDTDMIEEPEVYLDLIIMKKTSAVSAAAFSHTSYS